jgi:hypothetical protein
VLFSKLIAFMPDISSLNVYVNDTNRRYDNNYDPNALSDFDSLPFEKRWDVTLWQYIYDEEKLKELEDISYSGSFAKGMTADFSELKLGILRIVPNAGYEQRRDSTIKTLSGLSDSTRFSLREIYIDKVNLPFLGWLVKDQTVTGSYNYTLGRTFDPLSPDSLIKNSVTHDSSINLPYKTEWTDPLSGALSLSYNKSDSIDTGIRIWSWSVTPKLSGGYALSLKQPITIWPWMPLIGGKVIKFENSLNLNGSLSVNMQKGDDVGANHVNQKDITEYDADMNVAYNVLNNIQTTFGLSYKNKKDRVADQNSFQLIGISLEVKAEF